MEMALQGQGDPDLAPRASAARSLIDRGTRGPGRRVTRIAAAALAAVAVGSWGIGPAQAVGSTEQQSPPPSAVLWVDDAATSAPPGTGCDDACYSTIQAAVDAAAPGDLIQVCPGTYSENVTIATDDLTIVSTDGAAVTTVQAATSTTVFLIYSPGVTLQGFTVVPAGVADGDLGIFVAIDGDTDGSLLENTVLGGRIGIITGCTSYGTNIEQNTLSGQTEGGINIDTCEAPPFPGSRKNSVHHNTVCGFTATASIALGGSSNHNDIHHNTVTSISVFGTGNKVHHNTTQLPVIDNGSGNNLHQNTVDPSICP